MANEWLQVNNKAGDIGEIHIYGMITDERWIEEDVSPGWFKEQVAKLHGAKRINMFVNSPGGGVFAGLAIHNMIKRFAGETIAYVDGIAASIASVVIMAAKKVVMPRNAMIMMHNPISGVVGYAEDMRKEADLLDRVKLSIVSTYVDKTKKTPEEISSLMSAETWLGGEDAVKMGFADILEDKKEIKACLQNGRHFVNGIEIPVGNFKSFPADRFCVAPTRTGQKRTVNAKMKILQLYKEGVCG